MSTENDEALTRYCNRIASISLVSFKGFDEGITPADGMKGQKEFNCCASFPCCGLVTLYAILGLHRYNFFQGKNLPLSYVKKYNKEITNCVTHYYITLVAKDPTSGCHQNFQTQIDEKCYGELDLSSYIARPQGTKDPILCCDLGPVDDFYVGSLPEWPQKKAFKDGKQLYVHDLSDLKIMEVVIETKEDMDSPSERLLKKNAIVYIRYHGKTRVGNPVDCIAIVRRTFGERKGKIYFSLQGRIQSAESIPKLGVLMEENKAKREDDDMISKLPDALISEILFYLPTKEAVRTSVLSNRWRSLWLLVPGLDLDSCEFLDFNAFSSFVNKCLDFSRENELCLHKLKLSIHQDENENHNQFCVTRWLDFVAKGKLKHLDVERFLKRKCLEVIMPVSLFVSQTLVYLRLSRVLFSTSFEESSVSLPRLKTLRLELNVYSKETSLESLISYIPMLEDLTIVRRVGDNVKYLRVRSQTLTSLRIKFQLRRQSEYYGEVDVLVLRGYGQGGFLIDAPRLKYLNIEDERTTIKTITNLGSLNKVNLLGSFFIRVDDQVRNFFTSLSGVRDMNLSIASFLYFMQVVPLPQFCNLYQLEVGVSFCYLDRLLMFLPSCPKLRSLILNLTGCWEQMSLSSVHLCLLSSLEFVEIECIFRRYPSLELVSNPQDDTASESEIFHARRKFLRLK